MPPDDEPLVWNDPLLPPPQPVGTSSGMYVGQPDPRPNPYTFEGEMVMLGQFVSGARRAQGPLGLVARVVVGAVLGGVVLTFLLGLRALFG